MNLPYAVALAKLSFAFGRVNRVTFHEDGVTPESDTDHTVMLGIIACALADEINNDVNPLPRPLDLGAVAQFAFIHDIVEVYAGDAQTLTITDKERASKNDRERAATDRIIDEFGSLSWLGCTLLTYERQGEPEARFVRVVDKILPKLTHLLNGCESSKKLTDLAGFKESHDRQLVKLSREYHDVHLAVFKLLREAMDASEQAWK
jgi:putative hydrolases of HD superfamily